MNLEDLKKPLKIKDIDFRVQSINKIGKATILAYKDARVDINRLNDVCGVLGWKREHTRDNKNCIVSIFDEKNKHWVSKEDTGTESNTEAQKGLASDSFKRACFNFGIGIELYDYPVISVSLFSNEWKLEKDRNGVERVKPTYELRLKLWKWSSVFENGVLVRLEAKDQNNKQRFIYDITNSEELKKPQAPKPIKPNATTEILKKAKQGGYSLNKVMEKYNVSKAQETEFDNL